MARASELDRKYTETSGRVFMSGTQALVRLPLVQMRRDRKQQLNTAAFVSGYRGSPLGAYDPTLEEDTSAAAELRSEREPRLCR